MASHSQRVKWALTVIVLLSLIVSLFWRDDESISVCDYIAQIGMFLLIVVGPFITSIQSSYWRMFWLIFGLIFIWGIWRFLYFDALTENDVPGIAYLIMPFGYAVISGVIFELRKLFIRITTKRS